MIKMNQQMKLKFLKAKLKNCTLSDELKSVVEEGFLASDGCFLLARLLQHQINVKLDDFPDRTGYECYINSIHIDDYVKVDFLGAGIGLLWGLFNWWECNFQSDVVLNAIISSEDMGVIIKFHVLRENESWVSENLEKYEDEILVIDSREIPAMKVKGVVSYFSCAY
jgi:hypothetical protein